MPCPNQGDIIEVDISIRGSDVNDHARIRISPVRHSKRIGIAVFPHRKSGIADAAVVGPGALILSYLGLDDARRGRPGIKFEAVLPALKQGHAVLT